MRDKFTEYINYLENNDIEYIIKLDGDNRQVVETYPNDIGNGEIVSFPLNIDENTQVVTYYHGADGFDKISITELENTNPNNVVVSLKGSMTYDKVSSRVDQNVVIFSNIFEDKGQYNSVSYSSGCATGINSSIDYINKNQCIDSQIITLIDPAYDAQCLNKLSQEDINTLRENNSIIISLDQTDATNYNSYNNLAQNGVHLILALNDNNHENQRDKACTNNIFDFQTGDSSQMFESDSYTYTYYDRQSKKWIPLTGKDVQEIINQELSVATIDFYSSNIRALEKLDTQSIYQYFEQKSKLNDIVTNNINFVVDKTNSLITAIQDSQLINTLGNNFSYESTTKTPTNNIEYIDQFLFSNLLLLDKFTNEVERIKQISLSVKDMDESLKSLGETIETGGIIDD